MQVIEVNKYLKFEVRKYKRGTAMTAIYDGDHIIGYKNACNHTRCNVLFIAEMTAVAEQMETFERVFSQTVNQN